MKIRRTNKLLENVNSCKKEPETFQCTRSLNFEKALDGFTGQVFIPLRNIEYFKNFTIVLNTVTWPNEADVSPDYLYEVDEEA
jgi:hypothetical protein